MHVTVALLQAGQRVATIDLDSGRKVSPIMSKTAAAGQTRRTELTVPDALLRRRGSGARLDEIEAQEFAAFAAAVSAVEQSHDFVVIDTPGPDS